MQQAQCPGNNNRALTTSMPTINAHHQLQPTLIMETQQGKNAQVCSTVTSLAHMLTYTHASCVHAQAVHMQPAKASPVHRRLSTSQATNANAPQYSPHTIHSRSPSRRQPPPLQPVPSYYTASCKPGHMPCYESSTETQLLCHSKRHAVTRARPMCPSTAAADADDPCPAVIRPC
jgi:hypothetical protein